MDFSETDRLFMSRALELAARARYTARPNPMVGCVLVRDGCIVGEGWHQRAGGPHAEIHALRHAGSDASGATAYVSLEPCAHHGRTPPCSKALIRAGVRRVVAACEDPFPGVNGQGLAQLRQAGIAVETGLMREQATELNQGFLANARRARPWVRLKFGMSLDGRTALADGRSQWITGERAREDVQRWRLSSSAILTGSGTVLADDPRLTVRIPEAEGAVAPVRVVLDGQCQLGASARIFDTSAPTLHVHREGSAGDSPLPCHVERLAMPSRGAHIDLRALLTELGRRGLHDILIEAGPVLAGALLREQLVDELLLYVAPSLLGDSARPLLAGWAPAALDQAMRFELIEARPLGADLRLRLRPKEAYL